jgi:hypothetical protein
MDYVKPADVAKTMVETGARKLALPIGDLVARDKLKAEQHDDDEADGKD